MLAVVLVLAGCSKSQNPAPSAEKAAASVEQKTVEFVERSDADLRKHMAEWAQEGWTVLSISQRIVQPDGTVLRKVELLKPRALVGKADASH
jgi:hypothetical protein